MTNQEFSNIEQFALKLRIPGLKGGFAKRIFKRSRERTHGKAPFPKSMGVGAIPDEYDLSTENSFEPVEGVVRCIDGIHVVEADVFKPVTNNFNIETAKGSVGSHNALKILEGKRVSFINAGGEAKNMMLINDRNKEVPVEVIMERLQSENVLDNIRGKELKERDLDKYLRGESEHVIPDLKFKMNNPKTFALLRINKGLNVINSDKGIEVFNKNKSVKLSDLERSLQPDRLDRVIESKNRKSRGVEI